METETGFEPAMLVLQTRALPTWLLRQKLLRPGSNRRWTELMKLALYQLSYAALLGAVGIEPTHTGTKNRCLTT